MGPVIIYCGGGQLSFEEVSSKIVTLLQIGAQKIVTLPQIGAQKIVTLSQIGAQQFVTLPQIGVQKIVTLPFERTPKNETQCLRGVSWCCGNHNVCDSLYFCFTSFVCFLLRFVFFIGDRNTMK